MCLQVKRVGPALMFSLMLAACAGKAPPDSADAQGTPQPTPAAAATFTPAALNAADPPIKLATTFITSLQAGDVKAAEATWDFTALIVRDRNRRQNDFEEWAGKHQPTSYKVTNVQYYDPTGSAAPNSDGAKTANVHLLTEGGALPANLVLKVTKLGSDRKITDILTSGR